MKPLPLSPTTPTNYDTTSTAWFCFITYCEGRWELGTYDEPWHYRGNRAFPVWHPLTHVSRQLRDKTSTFRYAVMTFEVGMPSLKWLVALLSTPLLGTIKTLRMMIDTSVRYETEFEDRTLLLLGKMGKLERMVLVPYDQNWAWRTSAKQKALTKEAVKKCAGNDTEIV
jgi:hypothetical protein